MIRKFEKNDIDIIMQIWIKENIKAHDFIAKQYWEENFESVKKMIPMVEIYVAIYKNEIVGFIGINGNHIEGIFVASNKQGCGFGSALLEKAKENRNTLTLSVFQKNRKAIEFYKKNGFEIEKEGLDVATNEKEYEMKWKKQV